MNTFTVGLDLGQAQDYSALCVVERSIVEEPGTGRPVGYHAVRHLHRWKLGTPYTEIVEDVAQLVNRHPLPGSLLALDATGVGRAVVDMFRVARLPVRLAPVTITGVMSLGAHPVTQGEWRVPKKDLVAVIQMLIHADRLYIVPELKDSKILGREIRQFRVKVTAAGNESFEALRERDHDDMVLSVAMACWCHERGEGRLIFYCPHPDTVRAEMAAAGLPPPDAEPREHTPEEVEAELRRAMEKQKRDYMRKLAGIEEPGVIEDGWKDWR